MQYSRRVVYLLYIYIYIYIYNYIFAWYRPARYIGPLYIVSRITPCESVTDTNTECANRDYMLIGIWDMNETCTILPTFTTICHLLVFLFVVFPIYFVIFICVLLFQLLLEIHLKKTSLNHRVYLVLIYSFNVAQLHVEPSVQTLLNISLCTFVIINQSVLFAPLTSTFLSPFHPPCTNFVSRSFRSAAPVIWNSLPLAIRTSATIDTFKRSLKTHCFCFPPASVISPCIRFIHAVLNVNIYLHLHFYILQSRIYFVVYWTGNNTECSPLNRLESTTSICR